MTDDPALEVDDGLRAVFLQIRERLIRFVQRNGGGDNSDDILQDVWIKLGREPARPVGDPVSYLYRVAYNVMLDRHRGETRSGRREQLWLDVDGPDRAGMCEAPSIERVLIAQEAVRAAQAQLERLGEPTATIFRLHRIEGITQQRIARQLGMGLSTVEKHLRRAYLKMIELKDRLDEA